MNGSALFCWASVFDILEAGLRGPEREELVDLLLEKAAADRYPSVPMLERIARIAH